MKAEMAKPYFRFLYIACSLVYASYELESRVY